MRLLLVDNLIMPEEGSLALLDVHPHLGLLALAAVAEADGHEVQIVDPKRLIRSGALRCDASLYEQIAAELLARRPQAVGFTTLGCSFLFALNVAALLKRREPDLPILLGGPHATMLHRPILERFPQFDIVARHECDETFPALLDALPSRRFHHIPGISWRAGAGPDGLRFTEGKPKVEDLDSLPIARYDHYPVKELGLDLLRIEAGRGCPFSCTFCSTAGFFQRSFRLKSAPRLVQELDLLHERYGFVDFKLDHDMFTVNRHKVLEFCEAVKGRGYRWRASARVDCVDDALLQQMAAAGCVSLYFGIETGSARMQRICQKRLDLSLVHPILHTAERLGISTTASFITGYPEEEEEDQADTLDMLGRCHRPGCLAQLHLLAPEPGTPMFEQHGDKLRYDGHGGPYNAELVAPGDEALVRTHADIFQTYHHYPAAMPRERYVFAVDAVALLRRAGPLLLHYLLRAHDGRLSVLVNEMRMFAESRGGCGRPDDALMLAYVAHRFGPRHHLLSLLRYALRMHQGGFERSAAPVPPAVPRCDPAQPLRISPQVEWMELHDCAALLERIRALPAGAGLLDDVDAGETGPWLFVGQGEHTRSTPIDKGVEAILGLFDPPRSAAEVMRIVQKATGSAGLTDAFFEQLLSAGILEPAPAPQRQDEAAQVDLAHA